jgi:hypothetical protein
MPTKSDSIVGNRTNATDNSPDPDVAGPRVNPPKVQMLPPMPDQFN